MKRWNVIAKAAAAALVLAIGASLWLALWPGFYKGVAAEAAPATSAAETQAKPPAQTRQFSRSLVDVNGVKVVPILIFPVAVTLIALLAALWRDVSGSKLVLWANAGILVAFCLVAAFSVGLFYLPAAAGVMTAAFLNQWSRPLAPEPRGRRRGNG